MPGLFDDIVDSTSAPQSNGGGMFDDIFEAPSFANVNAGASSSPLFSNVQGGSTTVKDQSDYAPDFLKDQQVANSPSVVGNVQSGGASTATDNVPAFARNVIGTDAATQQDLDTNQSDGPAVPDINGRMPWQEGYDRISGEYLSREAARTGDSPETVRQRALERVQAQQSGLQSAGNAMSGTVAKGFAGLGLIPAAAYEGVTGDDAALEAMQQLNANANARMEKSSGVSGHIGSFAGGVFPTSFIGGPSAGAMDVLDQGGTQTDAQTANLKGALINELTLGAGRYGAQGPGILPYVSRASVQAGTMIGINAVDAQMNGRSLETPEVVSAIAAGVMGGFGTHETAKTAAATAHEKALSEGKDSFSATTDALNAIKTVQDIARPVEQGMFKDSPSPLETQPEHGAATALPEKPRGRYNHETGKVEGLFDDLVPKEDNASKTDEIGTSPIGRRTAQEALQSVLEPESTLGSGSSVETQPRAVQEATEASEPIGRDTPQTHEHVPEIEGFEDLVPDSPLASPDAKQFPAWHGSPHDFDSFDSSRIGSGEGNQSYGHGLYFAGDKSIAQHYRDVLSSRSGTTPERIAEYYTPGRIIKGYGGNDRVLAFDPGTDGHDWTVTVKGVDANGNDIQYERVRSHRTTPEQKEIDRVLGPSQKGGSLFHVDIVPHEEDFLHWDNAINKQSPKVQQSINEVAKNAGLDFSDGVTGKHVYKALTNKLGGQQEASEVLSKAGVPGVRYLDSNSRHKSEGTHNYVVFDDSHIRVESKNGVATKRIPQSTEHAAPSPSDILELSKQANVPLRVMREYHEGTLTTGKLLDSIVNNEGQKYTEAKQFRGLAEYLKEAGTRLGGLDTPINRFDQQAHGTEVEHQPGLGADKAAGYYQPGVDAIRVHSDAPNMHLLLHESVHALTTRQLLNGERGQLSGEPARSFATLSNVFDAINAHDKAGKIGKQSYGFTNVHEMMAEFFSNGVFRKELKNIKLSDVPSQGFGRLALSKVKNMYQAVMGSVRGMLNMPEKAETAMDALFTASHKFLNDVTPADRLVGNERGQLYTSPAMERSGPTRQDIEERAQVALSRGADPALVKQRMDELLTKHGHNEPSPATSTKNAVMEAERQAAGRDPIIKQMSQSNPELVSKAQDAIAKNPERPAEIIKQLNDDGVKDISPEKEAILIVAKRTAMNERDAAANRASDPTLSSNERAAAQQKWHEQEALVAAMEQATANSGTAWGQFGQFRQQMLKADFTFEAMQRKMRAATGGPLREELVKQTKADHESIATAQAHADKTAAEVAEFKKSESTYDKLVKQMADSLRTSKKRPTLERLAAMADESREYFRKSATRLNSGVDPVAFLHLARIGAYHIANGAVKFAEWSGKMKSELGDLYDSVKEALPKVFEASQVAHAAADGKTSPARVAGFQQTRINSLNKQIEALNKQLETGEKPTKKEPVPPTPEVQKLRDERDLLKSQLKAVEDAKKPSPEERYQAQRGKSIAKRLAEVKDRDAKGDYEKRPRTLKELNAENTKAQYELDKAKGVFNRHAYEAQMEQRHPFKKFLGTFTDTQGLLRSIMTSVDLSAVFRQGGFIALGHPLRAAKAAGPMLRAAMSEHKSYEIMKEIETRPNARLYKKAKLDLTYDDPAAMHKAEEQYMSRYIEYTDMKEGEPLRNAVRTGKNTLLAPVRASERAFKTFLNRLRADSFDSMVASLAKDGKNPTDAEINAIASYINVATGRGKLGTNPSTAVGLNSVFFAPRLVASRFNLLAGQPLYGGTMRTRGMIAQEYARFLTGVGVTMGLAYFMKDKDDKTPFINTDPRSSDFMKMRFGNTFVDPLAGLSQSTVLLSREISGETINGKGQVAPLRDQGKLANLWRKTPDNSKVKYGQRTEADVLASFARSKLAPFPGALVNMVTGKDVIGNPVTAASTAQNLVVPMSLDNIYNVMKDAGVPRGTAITLLDMLGMSVQYHDPTKKHSTATQKSN